MSTNTMNPYWKSVIFFTKVSISCFFIQWLLDNYFDLNHWKPISYPFFHWLANFFFYYGCGYITLRLKDSSYLTSYKILNAPNVTQQVMNFDCLSIIKGELIFLLMCYGYGFFIEYSSHSPNLIFNLAWFYLCVISADFTFYVIHYTLHKKFYWIHKKHHEYIDLNGFVAEYKSLLEALVITTSDILPFLIFGTSINQLIAWIIVGVLYNVEGHSSMKLFYIIDNFHHKHHTHFNVNYGIAQYLDHIFGTM
ncbi:unnamed protein product [Rotaria socialis]|uniref:Fatty acid hydroxylase domain-containing protein n=2 Tax=Rotaria socialis TaxID=392032 RepID=A0A820QW32_9BILA|nr:unnamed protein product [Rotaria socialis]CAF3332052.1 unnamed protein product [Rotaria socialis]CAF3347623.1 unnamed protein product [Rotaria socialis]CAF3797521.1 unnamed protein product [Rotaria socialis]CAF4380845.1 unnamed protein product [Rotaria socialis]